MVLSLSACSLIEDTFRVNDAALEENEDKSFYR